MSTHSRTLFFGLLIVTLWLFCTPLQARLNIEIFGGGTERIPIAIVPFADEDRLQQRVTDVVAADLQRSGLFRLIDPTGLTPYAPAEVVYNDWAGRGASALVIGRTILMPGGQVEIQFRLMDVAKQAQLTGLATIVPMTQLRAAAHRIADII